MTFFLFFKPLPNMCGRYTFIAPAPAAEKRFDATFAEPAPTTYNAAPS